MALGSFRDVKETNRSLGRPWVWAGIALACATLASAGCRTPAAEDPDIRPAAVLPGPENPER